MSDEEFRDVVVKILTWLEEELTGMRERVTVLRVLLERQPEDRQ